MQMYVVAQEIPGRWVVALSHALLKNDRIKRNLLVLANIIIFVLFFISLLTPVSVLS